MSQLQHNKVLWPIWTHSPQPPRCIHIAPMLGKDPWSQLPKHQRYPPEDCSSGALHLGNWYSRVFGILGNAARIPLRLHTCLAKRIRFAKLLHGSGKLCNVLHRVRSDNALGSCGSHIMGYNDGVNRLHRLWTDMGHPINGICWGESISSCLLPEVYIQSP